MEYQVALIAHRELPRRWWRRRRCACGLRWERCPDAARPPEHDLTLPQATQLRDALTGLLGTHPAS